MLRIFLASHGHLASGIKSSLSILIGNAEHMTVFDAYVDASSVQEHLDKFYETISVDDQVLLLSDLYGGSVNQVMYLYLEKPNTMLVAGVNLACVLELSIKDSIDKEELQNIVEQSREMLRIVELDTNTKLTQESFF